MADVGNSSHGVPHEDALAFATVAHRFASRVVLTGLGSLVGTALETEATTIYDLNGQPLFHDFMAGSDHGVEGSIRIAANELLGSPLVSMSGHAPRWSPRKGLRLATERLHSIEPGARVIDWRLVCYAYPKIAVELTYVAGDGDPARELFDASSGGVVGGSDDPDNQFTRYSLLSHLERERDSRLDSFTAAAERMRDVLKTLEDQQRPNVVPWRFPIILSTSGTVLQSPYCAGSPPGNSHYAQITDYFCVCASAQMLMEHYGWNYTQNEIAVAMGTSAAQGGTTGAGLTSGFASLTHNQFSLAFDGGASRGQQFADAVAEIDSNRPVFTQVPHHYRVCMGYSELLMIPGGPFDQQLYIYDPWPWNPDLCQPGAAYWESWATSPVMWFGIVQHV
jgi:Peptidase_C39 like family